MSFENKGIPGTVVGYVTIKGIPFFHLLNIITWSLYSAIDGQATPSEIG